MNISRLYKMFCQSVDMLEEYIGKITLIGEIEGMKVYVHPEEYGLPKYRVYDDKDQGLALIRIPQSLSDEVHIIDGDLNSSQKDIIKSWMPKKNYAFDGSNLQTMQYMWEHTNKHLTRKQP